MYRFILSIVAILIFFSSGCTTLLLKDDFENRPILVNNAALVGSIPEDPAGDRVFNVLAPVSMVESDEFDSRALSIANEIIYECADHEAFGRYIATWQGFKNLSLVPKLSSTLLMRRRKRF